MEACPPKGASGVPGRAVGSGIPKSHHDRRGIQNYSEIRRPMKVGNEHGRPEGRPWIQHGKAGLSPSWRRGSHRIRPWRRMMRVRQLQGQPFSFCRKRTSTRKRKRQAQQQLGRPSCRKQPCRSRSNCWSKLRLHLGQRRHTCRSIRLPWRRGSGRGRRRNRNSLGRIGSRRGSPWPRER